MKSLANIDHLHTAKLHVLAMTKTPELYLEIKRKGYALWTVDQTRGRCYYGARLEISVPLWAWRHKDGEDYVIHYLCHEIAHGLVGYGHGHDITWYEKLVEICPCGKCGVREYHYKPRVVRSFINGKRG